MKLYTRDAEKLLYDKAKSISEQHSTWRCVYIDFSSHKEQYSEGLRTHVVTNIIKELLEIEDGHIYLCDGGDVFILFQGRASDIVSRIGAPFDSLRDGKPGSTKDSFYTIFDLGLHWQAFFMLCTKKNAEFLQENSKPALVAGVTSHPKTLPGFNEILFQGVRNKRPGRKKLVVLVVEDDPFTRRLVTGTLKTNFDVVEAGDGLEAIRAYETTAPDAVFLDIELPDTNGHVLLHKLLGFDNDAFIVMLSANSIKENILAALEKGAQGFVTKPFAKEKLFHYLRLCEAMRQDHGTVKAGVAHV